MHGTLFAEQLGILSTDELLTTQQFHSNFMQQRYICYHVALRYIIGSYLKCPPKQVPFIYNKHNKPYLIPEKNPLRLEFNISHSKDLALCAISTKARVGVDIEGLRNITNGDNVAKQILTKTEQDHYFSSPQTQRSKLFFKYWTLKEAFVKAIGEGLNFDLDQVEFILTPNASPNIQIIPYPEESQMWTTQSFSPCTEYIAAIATKQPINKVVHFEWHAEEFLKKNIFKFEQI